MEITYAPSESLPNSAATLKPNSFSLSFFFPSLPGGSGLSAPSSSSRRPRAGLLRRVRASPGSASLSLGAQALFPAFIRRSSSSLDPQPEIPSFRRLLACAAAANPSFAPLPQFELPSAFSPLQPHRQARFPSLSRSLEAPSRHSSSRASSNPQNRLPTSPASSQALNRPKPSLLALVSPNSGELPVERRRAPPFGLPASPPFDSSLWIKIERSESDLI
nr:unnamed protein product [Digitaria exilis]